VGDYAAVETAVTEGVEEIGNVDILINNVGLYAARSRN
jgi:NADP-dependent 3-hydroxy acid dehydrogenase YdfG